MHMSVSMARWLMVVAVTAIAVGGLARPSAAQLGEGAATSSLDPHSISGALFAATSDGYSVWNVPAKCAQYADQWRDELVSQHAGFIAFAESQYDSLVALNEEYISLGLAPPFPALPPTGTRTQAQHVAIYMAAIGVPLDPGAYVDQEWVDEGPFEQTDEGIPCSGEDALLPYPTGGGIIIPPPVDLCADPTALAFVNANWEYVPEWDPRRVDADPNGILATFGDGVGQIVIPWPFNLDLTIVSSYECILIFPGDMAQDAVSEDLPTITLNLNPSGPGLTGIDTWLWYDFTESPPVVDINAVINHRGVDWTLVGKAWVDEVGWDMDYEGGDPLLDVWIDLADTEWEPATDYVAAGGSEDNPPRIYVYETKDFYDVATALVWRGYYTVTLIADDDSPVSQVWSYTAQYSPVLQFEVDPYQVDEIVSRNVEG